MIRDPDCPRCYGRMVYDMGPKCDPTEDGNVDIEAVWRCSVCRWEVAVHQHTWSDVEIARRVAAIRSTADLDARGEELARQGYTPGKRWWPPC